MGKDPGVGRGDSLGAPSLEMQFSLLAAFLDFLHEASGSFLLSEFFPCGLSDRAAPHHTWQLRATQHIKVEAARPAYCLGSEMAQGYFAAFLIKENHRPRHV